MFQEMPNMRNWNVFLHIWNKGMMARCPMSQQVRHSSNSIAGKRWPTRKRWPTTHNDKWTRCQISLLVCCGAVGPEVTTPHHQHQEHFLSNAAFDPYLFVVTSSPLRNPTVNQNLTHSTTRATTKLIIIVSFSENTPLICGKHFSNPSNVFMQFRIYRGQSTRGLIFRGPSSRDLSFKCFYFQASGSNVCFCFLHSFPNGWDSDSTAQFHIVWACLPYHIMNSG